MVFAETGGHFALPFNPFDSVSGSEGGRGPRMQLPYALGALKFLVAAFAETVMCAKCLRSLDGNKRFLFGRVSTPKVRDKLCFLQEESH